MESAQQLIEETADRVEANWREHKVPLLLSALGNIEGGRISREAKRHAESLRAFLEAEVAHRVSVVQHSNRPTVIGVVPKTESTSSIQDWDSLLDDTGARPQLPRLHPALWAAFRMPIAHGKDRYVRLSEPLGFVDVTRGGETIPEDRIQVDHTAIAGPDAPRETVYEKATTWLRDNKLDVSAFRGEAAARGSTRLPPNDLLGRLILALDSRELQKISIPMEIVAKLRRHAV